MNTRQEILEAAIDHFGVDNQIGIAMEECAELIQALSKYRRYGESAIHQVIGEMADVQIMLDQLKKIFDKHPHDLESAELGKLYRLKQLIIKDKAPE